MVWRRQSSNARRCGFRRAALAAGCVAIAVGVGACGGGDEGEPDEGSGSSDGTVTIGASTQLSGNLQVYGAPSIQGLEGAVEDINAAGGVKVGDKTYEMAVAAEDNRSDPSAVVSATRAVVEAGAIAALGPDIGGRPSYEIFRKNDIITFAVAFELQLEIMENPEDNPLLFTPIPFLAELFGSSTKQFLAELPDVKRVAILSPNHEEGTQKAEAYAAAAEAEGLTVVANEGYAPNATDFTSVLTSIKEEQPDMLMAFQSAEQSIAILQQAAQLDVARYGLNDVLTPDQVQEAQGLEKLPVVIPNFSPTFSPASTIPDYEPEVVFGGQEPKGAPGAAIVNYYTVFLLKQAIEDAGTVSDAMAIAKELPGQSYDGPFGTCTVSDRRELDCETTLDIVEGDKLTVYRFPDPDSVEAIEVYTCQEGDCTAQ
jgi:branched-chain amino acid transport system substrate-binding protein